MSTAEQNQATGLWRDGHEKGPCGGFSYVRGLTMLSFTENCWGGTARMIFCSFVMVGLQITKPNNECQIKW